MSAAGNRDLTPQVLDPTPLCDLARPGFRRNEPGRRHLPGPSGGPSAQTPGPRRKSARGWVPATIGRTPVNYPTTPTAPDPTAPGRTPSNTATSIDLQALVASLGVIGDEWRADRAERQDRTSLDAADFDRLAAAGFLAAAAPTDQGGGIQELPAATRPLAEGLRGLAGGDPSVALVAAMHPSVLGYWLATPDGGRADWAEQRRAVFASAVAGSQWGTITSEPGSGGDISRTRTVAVPADGVDPVLPGRPYRLTGQKHFGSGSCIAQFMVTTARPEV